MHLIPTVPGLPASLAAVLAERVLCSRVLNVTRHGCNTRTHPRQSLATRSNALCATMNKFIHEKKNLETREKLIKKN